MNLTLNDQDRMELSVVLPWLVAMGMDEVLCDAPVNRFQAAAPLPVVDAPKPRTPLVQAPPKPMVNWKAVAAGAEGVAAAEALAASITTVEAYVEAYNSFDTHPLKRTASKACTVAGDMASRVLVLCDKPRNPEDATGDVLAGNHQILADRMLAAIGLSGFGLRDGLEAVVMANFIPWRPPGNRAVLELEAKMCVPLAKRLLQLLSPKLILCFGALPTQWMAGGEEAIFKARGKWTDIGGIPALTTFHPETLLNSPASKRLAWHDLQAFRARLAALT
jgi:uracil-DNA glycosylase